MDLLARNDENTFFATKLVEECKRKRCNLCISFLSIANFAYITRKQNKAKLFENLSLICSLFHIISNTESHITKAMSLNASDFEDAIQYETASSEKCDCIITRNKKDFSFSTIPVYTPTEFLNL